MMNWLSDDELLKKSKYTGWVKKRPPKIFVDLSASFESRVKVLNISNRHLHAICKNNLDSNLIYYLDRNI